MIPSDDELGDIYDELDQLSPVRIYPGNRKLGNAIPNVSIVPGRDCANCDHCVKDCYALKAWKQYPSVRQSWSANSAIWRADPFRAAQSVVEQLRRKRKLPELFRIHVAGEFLNQDHVEAWALVAGEFPSVKFLAFTKMHGLDFAVMPENVSIVFSQWPGMPDESPAGSPRAWMDDGTDERIPDDAIECPGECESCGACWTLSDIGRDVVFHKH
jgi:ferredoxin